MTPSADSTNPGLPILPESFTYTFDDIGNRKDSSVGASTTIYDANLLNQYTAITPPTAAAVAPLHDDDGNLTDDGRWHYIWNAENRLVAMQATPATVALGAPNLRLTFTYDYQGRRTGMIRQDR